MTRYGLVGAVLVCGLACLGTGGAQDKGYWRAASKNASAITGDIALSNEKLAINFLPFTMAEIHSLNATEIGAVFDVESGAGGVGTLYRVVVPATRKFLHKNSLCGGEDTQYMVTYAVGKSLQVAFFSGAAAPLLTMDAIQNSTDLCGTFSYTR
jgi:F0F1-type ATP synthase membrane subunit c/vacuolar-type H+-ATPase subunit K